MEIAEVEVHRRPQHDDDDDGCRSGEESPPIGIGAGTRATTGGEVNPLAPCELATSSPIANEGGGYTNVVALDHGEETAGIRPPPAHRNRNQCEIEIEPGPFLFQSRNF